MPAAPISRTFSPAASAAPGPAFTSARRPTRTLHLAAAIDGRGHDPAAYYVELARLAEGGALDFVTLGGADGSGGDPGDGCAPDVLARVAPATDRIGLVPVVDAAREEPFDLALTVATLDWVSHGRAGWAVTAPDPATEQGADGPAALRAARRRRAAERAEARWRLAAEVTAAVSGFWDGGGGPKPPQGRLLGRRGGRHGTRRARDRRPVRRHRLRPRRPPRGRGRDPRRTAAARGRVGPRPRPAAGARRPHRRPLRRRTRARAGCRGRPGGGRRHGVRFSGGPVDLAELIARWQRSDAVDGFHIRPVEPRRDLERFVNGTVALLQHRGLFRAFHPGATLREHLGLHRPEVRFAAADRAAEAVS